MRIYLLLVLFFSFNYTNAQIEIESVSKEKVVKSYYDSLTCFPKDPRNLIGQSVFVLPTKENIYYDLSFYKTPKEDKEIKEKSTLANKQYKIEGVETIGTYDDLAKKFLKLVSTDNSQTYYWLYNENTKRLTVIGYIEKIKLQHLGKKYFFNDDFFNNANLIKNLEIKNKKSEWTTTKFVFDPDLEKFVFKLNNSENETVACVEDAIIKNLSLYKNNNITETEVFTTIEQMPEYKGGLNELFKYIGTNITYPEKEKEAGIQGTVYVKFVVNEDGAINNITIQKGIKDGPNLEAEAIRLVKNMPPWNPGLQNGKPVKVWYSLPIKFTLH